MKHQSNVVKHLFFNHKSWKRRLLFQLLKRNARYAFFTSMRDGFFSYEKASSSISQKSINILVDSFPISLRLENFFSRNGNLSSFEILCIASLVAYRKPKRILEIGTFDGNTTLQLALNTSKDAVIHTMDLPPGQIFTQMPVLDSDMQFIMDQEKVVRKFESTEVASKIRQHYGDSTVYDFSQFTKEGPLDFIFIDGGHSYFCVKSDTENALKILAINGCIIWHDFTPFFGGVYQYLCELSQKYSLVNIEGTNLVVLYN